MVTAAGQRDGWTDGWTGLIDDGLTSGRNVLLVTYEPCFCVEACVPDLELALYLFYHID